MKAAAIALILGTMLTVEQRDQNRSSLDPPSSAVSADGRFVAFVTYSQLAPADADNTSDLYVLDRARQHVTLESADAGMGASSHPGISGDGRFVVFEHGDLVALRDRRDGITTIVGEGHHPAITGNGRIVLFSAGGFDRVTDIDVNSQQRDIYSVDLQDGQARRVSVDLHGMDARSAASVRPSASRDGRYVAFSSKLQATTGNRGGVSQIFVRDTVQQVTRLVGAGWDPSLSGDGRFVAFARYSNRLAHIFVADLQTGATHVVTKSVRRGLANGMSAKPALSADGRFVVFQSEASDLVAVEDDNLLWDVFVLDRTTNAITRLSGDRQEEWMAPSGGPSIDATGSVVAFSSRHPTDASDKKNDFDLYVTSLSSPNTQASWSSPASHVAYQLSHVGQVRPLCQRKLQVLYRLGRS